jgi:hypothetical protein
MEKAWEYTVIVAEFGAIANIKSLAKPSKTGVTEPLSLFAPRGKREL